MWSQKISDSLHWVLWLVRHGAESCCQGFSSSHPLKPGQHYLLKTLDVCLRVEPEIMFSGGIMSTWLVITLDWVFGFRHYESVLRLTRKLLKILILSFRRECQVQHDFFKFVGEGIAWWYHFSHRSIHQTFVCCIVDKTWKKSAGAKWKIHKGDNLRIALCVCVCVCVKVNMDQNPTVWRKQKNVIQTCEFIMMWSRR